MNKLYILKVVENADSWAQELACSNSVNKLVDITFTKGHCWTINNSTNDNEVRYTDKSEFPYYTISEFPYVC